MDANRPNMQENGRDMAIAPDPIFEICPDDNIRNSNRLGIKFLRSLNLPEAALEKKSKQACWQWQELEHPAISWWKNAFSFSYIIFGDDINGA